MYDEWTAQDFSSLAGEVPHDPGDVGVPQIMFVDRSNARVFEGDFHTGMVIGTDPDLTFLQPDEFLIGGKTFDTGPLATDLDGDGVDDETSLPDITVTGTPPKTPAYDPPVIPEYDGGGVPPYNPGADGDSGGGGDQTTQPTADVYNPCDDRKADTLSDEINGEISRQPDSDRREYGALIWKDDAGNLHRTRLVPGTNGSVPFPADPNELGIDSYSRVVGLVHSHPSWVNLGTDDSPNWVSASEGYIHGADWAAMDGWVRQNNLSINNFTVYVTYQGQMKEYDYADNLSPALRNAPDSRGSQESGDYNPGASCPS